MSTMPSAPRRPLAEQLLRTRGQGIAAFVQQSVHSTSVGLEATTAFVQQLLAELEDALQIFASPTTLTLDVQLSDEVEVEIGTLISASSLTIRYVTERDAMAPVVERFGAAFRTVLRFPQWTKAMLGLKMVSLMGSTRLLESFGAHVTNEKVLEDLHWLFALFSGGGGDGDGDVEMKINYLLRPAAEQLTVAIQSHPAIHSAVFQEILPILFELAPTFSTGTISDAVAAELLTTIAIIIDLKLPSPNTTAFSLLPMPAFALEEEGDEASGENGSETDNIHILQRQDQDEDQDATKEIRVILPPQQVVDKFCETLVTWLAVSGRRRGVVANLPHLCGALAVNTLDKQTQLLCTSLLASIEAVELHQTSDFEYFLAGLEALRDLGRREAFPKSLPLLDQEVLAIIQYAMPRLQSALGQLDPVDKAQLRTIKSTCSMIREVLIEIFIWWVHHVAANENAADLLQMDALRAVAEKLADPRVHGDLLMVVMRRAPSTDDDNSVVFQQALGAALGPLVCAVKQLDRYSKVAASRILQGIARVAIAGGSSIVAFADELATPLITRVGSCKAKALHQRLSAVACVLVSCAKDDSFVLDNHEWVRQLVDALLDAGASHNVHALSILDELIRKDAKIRKYVASVCALSQDVIAHIAHNALSSWPIFTEDMDAVLLVLGILSVLLTNEQELRETSVDAAALAATVSSLLGNAQDDDQPELVEACRELLQALA